MINVHNLSISFQGEYLFEDIAFKIAPGDRVGLIGKNGAGKTTMLRILAKEQEPDSGNIATDKELKIGFLKQDTEFDCGKTVLEETYKAFPRIKNCEIQLAELNKQLSSRTDYESNHYNQLLIDLSEKQHQYNILGGYTYKGQTEKVLQGLGFEANKFNLLTDTFSGGWRMRIELAKILLQNNDVLLLDEPTNHLDIESIIWFENFLKTYSGAVVLVSHDKMFLDQVTNRTIEISGGKIYDFKKSYSKYLKLRAEIRTQQLAAQKNQEKHIKQTQKLIDKFRAKASKATMAQSLIKKLDKIEKIEVDADDNSVITVQFPISVKPGKVVIKLEGVSKYYGKLKVLDDISLQINRGSKTAFVGQNGQGKSTLAKIMVNEIDFKGNLSLGHNAQIGYFAQNQAEYLDPEKTVLSTMIDAANDGNRSKVRDILGAFLFRDDNVEKPVKVLSGGERNRLALAKLLLQPFNVLIMDEPTNHLDMQSKAVLKEALKRFEGTLILVSHDRDFLQDLTDRVFEFKDHKIKEYLGDINFYLKQRNITSLRDAEKVSTPLSTAKTDNKKDYENQKKIKSLNNKLSKIESQIKQLENSIKQDDVDLETNYDQTAANPNFFDTYNSKKQQLDSLMQDWELVFTAIEDFQK